MIIKKKFNDCEEVLVSQKELRSFILRCLQRVGCSPSHAQQMADVLICSDYRGHYSHGVNRLNIYVNDVATGSTKPDGEPFIIKEKGGTAWVDGNNLLGPVVGNYCMRVAVQKAKEHGIGMVVVKNSNHFGMAGWYAQYAMKHGLIGMAFTNTSPCVFPTRSAEKALGSNPICFAAPAKNGDNFFLDMASTTVALKSLISAAAKSSLTHGELMLRAERPRIQRFSPSYKCQKQVVLDGGGLQPLGGSELTGGYKGTALCMMVEVLCGILGGAAFGRNVRQWQTTETNADLGQCFMAIDPECFASGFADRLQTFIDETRDAKPLDASAPVLVAGDPERAHMAMCDELDGIVYKKSQLHQLGDIASMYDIDMLPIKEVPNTYNDMEE